MSPLLESPDPGWRRAWRPERMRDGISKAFRAARLMEFVAAVSGLPLDKRWIRGYISYESGVILPAAELIGVPWEIWDQRFEKS